MADLYQILDKAANDINESLRKEIRKTIMRDIELALEIRDGEAYISVYEEDTEAYRKVRLSQLLIIGDGWTNQKCEEVREQRGRLLDSIRKLENRAKRCRL